MAHTSHPLQISFKLAIASIAAFAAGSAIAAPARTETAVFAGGCFWGMEGVFEHVKGVRDVVSGYAGGGSPAEVVRISFDPAQISYTELLKVHATVAHDPTQVNRQGPDVGSRYRSAIFPQNAQQRHLAHGFLAQLRKSAAHRRPIATKIESGSFSRAGAHHQDFMRRNPRHPYIIAHDRPKLTKLRSTYPKLWVS